MKHITKIIIGFLVGTLCATGINFLFNKVLYGKSVIFGNNLMVNILIYLIFIFVAIIITYLLFYVLKPMNDFKKKIKIKGREDKQAEFLFNDKQIISSQPEWKTDRYDIYNIRKNQPKDILEKLNKKLKKTDVSKAGFVVRSIYNAKVKDLQTNIVSDMNVRVIGDSGSGKTAESILPTIMYNANLSNKQKPTMIINDTKGELYQNTAGVLEQQGYNVICFNLSNTSKSSAWNPLYPILKLWKKYINAKDHFIIRGCSTKAAIQAHCKSKYCYEHTDLECFLCIKMLEDEFESVGGKKFKISFINKAQNETSDIKDEYYFADEEQKNEYEEQISKEFKARAFGDINELASILWPQKEDDSSNSNFFLGNASKFFSGLLMFLLDLYEMGSNKITDKNFNLKAVAKIINDKTRLFNLIVEEVNKRDCTTKDWYSRIWDTVITYENNPRNVDNWYSTLTEKISIFDNVELDNIICENNIDIDEMIDKPTALFIIVPDNREASLPLTSLFVGQIYNQLIEKANQAYNLKLKRKVLFILDEFGNMTKIKPFIKAFSICRSRNIDIMICYQNLEQLDSKYGKIDSQSIIANVQTTIFISSQNERDYETISKALGTVDELNLSISDKRATTTTLNEQARLITSEELKKLPKPLCVVMVDKTNFIAYNLPCWIGQKYLKNDENKFIYPSVSLKETKKLSKQLIFEKGYNISLENEFIFDVDDENSFEIEIESIEEEAKEKQINKDLTVIKIDEVKDLYKELKAKKVLTTKERKELIRIENGIKELARQDFINRMVNLQENEKETGTDDEEMGM